MFPTTASLNSSQLSRRPFPALRIPKTRLLRCTGHVLSVFPGGMVHAIGATVAYGSGYYYPPYFYYGSYPYPIDRLTPSLTELALTTTRTTGRTGLLAEHTAHMAVLPEPPGTTRPPERPGEPSGVAVCMAVQERPAHTTCTRVLTVQRGRARMPIVNGEAPSLRRVTHGRRLGITPTHAARSRGRVVRRAAGWSVQAGKTEVVLWGRAAVVTFTPAKTATHTRKPIAVGSSTKMAGG